jgi:hypothetical protein
VVGLLAFYLPEVRVKAVCFRRCEVEMKFGHFSFGSLQIGDTTYESDVIIDRGEILKRKKKPSKRFRDDFGYTAICRRGHTVEVQTSDYWDRSLWQTASNGGSKTGST